MLLVLKSKDQETMRIAVDTWIDLIVREEDATVQTKQEGARKIFTIAFEKQGIHYTMTDTHLFVATKADDLAASLALFDGESTKCITAGPEYRALGLPRGPAAIVGFCKMDELVNGIAEAEHLRRHESMHRSCSNNMKRLDVYIKEFEDDTGGQPMDFDELKDWGKTRKNRRYVNPVCRISGKNKPLSIGADGKTSCPDHGSVAALRKPRITAPRRRRGEEEIFTAFGTCGFHLQVDGDRLRGPVRSLPPSRP